MSLSKHQDWRYGANGLAMRFWGRRQEGFGSLSIAALLICPTVAFAQVANYQIPEQDLSKALVTLAVKSGRNIIFSPTLVGKRRSTPVWGARDFAEALKIMLTGSHLRATIQHDGSVIVFGASEGAAVDDQHAALRRAPDPPKPDKDAKPSPEAQTRLSAVIVTARRAQSFPLTTTNALTARLTAQDLEVNPGSTVLEPLGNLPGVTVINGGQVATNSVPIDLAGRGEANYASLRGLEAGFNLVTVNGVDVALSQPYSRGVQLNLLPSAGLAQVSIDKSLALDMAGDAIGGVIDFRTPNAFDFPGATHAAISASGQLEDEAIRYGRQPLGGSLSLEGSRIFGPGDTLGVYAGAYYSAESYSNGVVDGIYPAVSNFMFTYAEQTATGASAPGLNPASNLVLTGLDAGLTTGLVQRFGGDLSLDWRPSAASSAYLRLTLAEAFTNQSTYYSQTYGNQVTSQPLGSSGLYTPVIGYVQPRYYYETNPETALLDTLQVGAATRMERWTLSARANTSWSETDDPNHFELSGRDPEVAPGIPFGGSVLFGSRDDVPIPLLKAAGLQALGDAADYGARRAGELTREYSNQLKSGARLDASYRLTSWASLATGVEVTDAVRSHTYRDYLSSPLYTTDANDPSLSSLGILSASTPAAVPGVFNYPLPTVNSGKALALFNSNIAQNSGVLANAIDGCANLYVNNYNCDTQHGSEMRASAYAMGRFQVSDLEVEAGFRYEYTLVRNRFWFLPYPNTSQETPGYFTFNHTIYLEPLPRLNLTYQPTPFVAYRGAIWASYSPPAAYQLGGGAQIGGAGGSAANGGATTVLEGNPNLKPVQALNIDISADLANTKGGQVSAAGFYKALSQYIYESVDAFSGATPTQTGDLVITQPHNGGAGRVYGLELSGRQRIVGPSSLWTTLELTGAVTLEQSQVNTLEPGLSAHERLLDQPNIDANLQATYTKGPGSLSLSYRYTGSYVAQYGTLGASSALDTWVRSAERLNLAALYQPASRFKTILSISNLLNDVSYHATIGEHSEAIPSLVYSGRTYVLTSKWLY
jgi:TonB-dependent receptor